VGTMGSSLVDHIVVNVYLAHKIILTATVSREW